MSGDTSRIRKLSWVWVGEYLSSRLLQALHFSQKGRLRGGGHVGDEDTRVLIFLVLLEGAKVVGSIHIVERPEHLLPLGTLAVPRGALRRDALDFPPPPVPPPLTAGEVAQMLQQRADEVARMQQQQREDERKRREAELKRRMEDEARRSREQRAFGTGLTDADGALLERIGAMLKAHAPCGLSQPSPRPSHTPSPLLRAAR